MENLQDEVLELEFHEFSRGMETINEHEFARILLRYTSLTEDETDEYLQRLSTRIRDSKVPHVDTTLYNIETYSRIFLNFRESRFPSFVTSVTF